jgi:hypothetical protein
MPGIPVGWRKREPKRPPEPNRRLRDPPSPGRRVAKCNKSGTDGGVQFAHAERCGYLHKQKSSE